MKFGVLLTPGPQTPAMVQKAEALGFDSAFFVDSPVLFGDPYITMAVAAVHTRTIKLGAGVANPVTRSSVVMASLVASLNAFAPGRIILGVGVGDTAPRAMGQRRATRAELERYVQEVRQLLRREVARVKLGNEERPVQFLNPQGPWLNLRDPIPIYVAAAGPQGLRLAGRVADAVILGGITEPHILVACREHIAQGARSAGEGGRDLEVAITPSVYLADRELSSEELQQALGPKSLAPAANFSRIAQLTPSVPQALKDDLARVRAAYTQAQQLDGDPSTRHLRLFGGYLTALQERFRPLITPRVLEATSIAGAVEQCVRKVAMLQAQGVGHIILSPLPAHVAATIEGWGTQVLPRFIG